MNHAALGNSIGPGQIMGAIPSWLQLGPAETVNGIEVREVLGDWSHRQECDRPPKYVLEGMIASDTVTLFDRSDTRPPVPQPFRGRYIGDLKKKHSGKVAVLFNGSSMGRLDLHKITVPTIGMNRTHVGFPGYNGPQPDYLCIVDHLWLDRADWRAGIEKHPNVINGSTHRANVGYRVARHHRMSPFSLDLARDGYVCPIPCTTGHLALQLAVYLGFDEIHCLGWDMGGPHFDGTHASLNFPDAIAYHTRQAKFFKEHGINVLLCESPESRLKTLFPHSTFEAVCG
jgi:hypothetical protein